MGNNNIKVSASILSADFLTLGNEINAVEKAGVDSIHLDVMDNHMAPTLSFGPPIIKPVRKHTALPLDAHLMIDAPWLFFDDYINCDVDEICFHIEAYCNAPQNHEQIKTQSRIGQTIDYKRIEKDIDYLKKHKIKPGITINPSTNIKALTPLLNHVDSVLIMSVHPGFSGQIFIQNAIERIRYIRHLFDGDIKVDGGVNDKNAQLLKEAGANTLITASYLFASSDYQRAINALR